VDADEALKLTNRIYARLNNRRPTIEKFESYYKGEQPLNYATEEWRKSNAARYSGFSDNWSRPIVDAEAERINYTGIKISDSTDAGKVLHEQWLLNEMDMQSSQGWVATLSSTRSFVTVWADADGEPSIMWEHPSNVEIEYDFANPRIRKAALKTWIDETTEYATLYEPDALWKFERPRQTPTDDRNSWSDQGKQRRGGDGGWKARLVRGESWPIPNPIGVVPVVEFQNRPLLGSDPISEIAGVIPMQDAINLLWAYLFLAADYASMPARVVLGGKPPMIPVLNERGEIVGSKPVDMKELGERRLFFTDGASIDSWEAARLDVFTETIETMVGHIAAQSRTPPHYLVSNKGLSNLPEGALKAAETGLTKKVMEFNTYATPALREVFRLVALVLGDEALARQTRLASIVFTNPEIRSESQLADALSKKQTLGYPFEYLMELDGIDPTTIERVQRMKRDEAEADPVAQASRELEVLGGNSTDERPALPAAAEDS
jgi:hypothetical protein